MRRACFAGYVAAQLDCFTLCRLHPPFPPLPRRRGWDGAVGTHGDGGWKRPSTGACKTHTVKHTLARTHLKIHARTHAHMHARTHVTEAWFASSARTLPSRRSLYSQRGGAMRQTGSGGPRVHEPPAALVWDRIFKTRCGTRRRLYGYSEYSHRPTSVRPLAARDGPLCHE